MSTADEFGWPEPPEAGDEVASLLGLEYQRATFAWCAGLDADGLAVTVGVSSLTLAGLLRHLALVEEYARHDGHADLLREAADGSVGE